MRKLEFYVSPEGETHVLVEGKDYLLRNQVEIFEKLYRIIGESFSEALKSCVKCARSLNHAGDDRRLRFLAVDRFVRCNFGNRDLTPDIHEGRVELEEVNCHLRGACEYEHVICMPRCSLLKDIEERCIAELCLHRDYKETAERCNKSIQSVMASWLAVRKRLKFKNYSQLAQYFKGVHLERRLGII